MMKQWWRKLYHPEIFQGDLHHQKYFEGWYFKLVSADELNAIAVIPGIAIYDPSDRHAFIQVIDGVRQVTSYHRFPLESFKASQDYFQVQIDNNYFSGQGIQLSIPELKGRIDFHDSVPLSAHWWSPGIMGWYSFVPKMECYHGIVSLHHTLSGHSEGSAGAIDWKGGKGYIEKDWGRSFPKCWIWMQSNHFNSSHPVSLMASVAHIPWMKSYFPGFIVVLYLHGVEYRFATYNGSKMKCQVMEDVVHLEFRKADLQLSIRAFRATGAILRSPISGRMTGKVNESLKARLIVQLTRKGREVWAGTGTTAGLEVAGETTILESGDWRK